MDAETRLKSTGFIVEANSFEVMCLWRENAKDSTQPPRDKCPRQNWEQLNDGWLVTVGKDNRRPVNISVRWFKIDGVLVCFWEAVSRIVNHKLIDEWFKKHFTGTYDNGSRRASTDANNFHLCIHALEEIREKRFDLGR
jgi:hypothetical protein